MRLFARADATDIGKNGPNEQPAAISAVMTSAARAPVAAAALHPTIELDLVADATSSIEPFQAGIHGWSRQL